MEKLEVTNKELRLSREPRDVQRRLELEVAQLQSQLASLKQSAAHSVGGGGKPDTSLIKKELSVAEQVKL